MPLSESCMEPGAPRVSVKPKRVSRMGYKSEEGHPGFAPMQGQSVLDRRRRVTGPNCWSVSPSESPAPHSRGGSPLILVRLSGSLNSLLTNLLSPHVPWTLPRPSQPPVFINTLCIPEHIVSSYRECFCRVQSGLPSNSVNAEPNSVSKHSVSVYYQ